MLFVGVPLDEQQRLAGFFAEHGIGRERVAMQDRVPLETFRELHRHVDVALDAHPYSGATTTCDSLWMGVPTLTLTGATSISRSTASLLHALGLNEWIARTPAEFIELGKRHAGDLQRLSALRAGLREKLQASPLMDAARFTGSLENAYRGMWQAYCGRVPAPG